MTMENSERLGERGGGLAVTHKSVFELSPHYVVNLQYRVTWQSQLLTSLPYGCHVLPDSEMIWHLNSSIGTRKTR